MSGDNSARCDACRHWSAFDEENGEEIGTCRRYPPQRIVENVLMLASYGGRPPSPNSQREWQQPTTPGDSWCGEFSA